MNNNWKAGDIGIIHSSPPWVANIDGEEVYITSSPYLQRGVIVVNIEPFIALGCKPFKCIDIRYIKKKYDGNEKTEWDESIFKPKELVVCPVESDGKIGHLEVERL